MSDRRNFLKMIGLSTLAIPTLAVTKSVEKTANVSSLINNGFLINEWKEDGINFLHYKFPSNVQAIFKGIDRGRAIYCPIRKATAEERVELIKLNKGHVKTHMISKFKQLVQTCFKREKLEAWKEGYIYIIDIDNHPELFGTMINKHKLEIELDQYTTFNGSEKINTDTPTKPERVIKSSVWGIQDVKDIKAA